MLKELHENRRYYSPRFVAAVAMMFAVVAALYAAAVRAGPLVAGGGGFLGGGINGSYYVDTAGQHFVGRPELQRDDDRIDFNWGRHPSFYTVAGSNTYRLPRKHFSVRWRGRLMARYSQTYRFMITSGGGGERVKIRPAGAQAWTMLTDDFSPHGIWRDTGRLKMLAGKVYDFKAEYYHSGGPAVMRVQWTCAAAPVARAIGPVVRTGINGSTAVDWDSGLMFADAMKMARIGQYTALSPGAKFDANGWPTGNLSFVLFTQPTNCAGTYTMTFKGQADVGLGWVRAIINSKTYNAATNTTKVVFTFPEPCNNQCQLTLSHTRRLPTDQNATGVTDLKIMRPIAPDAATSYPPHTTFTTPYKKLMGQFTAIRFMDFLGTNSGPAAGGNAIVHWKQRMKPSFSSQAGLGGGYQGVGGALEYAVELCNETGKDMWLNIPMRASNGYLHKLALALKYGFQANGDPYSSPQVNPAYPPLNSNLRLYLEYSNEVWNGGFYQHNLTVQLAQQAVKNHTANGTILAYDHTTDATTLGDRWWILRTKEISGAFRKVWGNAAMLRVVRPVFEFQYGNYNNTATLTLQFLANYFNNEDGHHVAHPHPPGYYLYAAGGGWYNSVNNDSGLGAVKIADAHFQIPAVLANTMQAHPAHAGWTFAGHAGLVGMDTHTAAAVVSTHLGTLTLPAAGTSILVGAKFTIGQKDVYAQKLGLYVAKGDTGAHQVWLFNASKHILVHTTINLAGTPAGHDSYISVGPLRLKARHNYYLLCQEAPWLHNDSFYAANTTGQTAPGITLDHAETVAMAKAWWDNSQWVWHQGPAGHLAGPVNFTYGTMPIAALGFPPQPQVGRQAAYLQGNGGSISQKVIFPAGVSAINILGSQGTAGEEGVMVYVDGQLLTQRLYNYSLNRIDPAMGSYQWRLTNPAAFTAGPHTIKLVGNGNGTVFINGVQIKSTAAMLQSGMKNTSGVWQTEADWSRAYGLRTVGYEGGFEIGGDSPNAVTQAANVAPQVRQFTADTLKDYLAAGGNVPIVFCATGGSYAVVMTAPLGMPNIFYQHTPKMAGYHQVMTHLPPPISNGTLVPNVLTPANLTLAYDNPRHLTWTYTDPSGQLTRRGGWMSWNILVPTVGNYRFVATATGRGRFALLVDSVPIAHGRGAQAAIGTMLLTPGLHAVKIRSTGTKIFAVKSVTVSQLEAPAAPKLNSVRFGKTRVKLSWSAVPGAVDYLIAYGHAPGALVHFIQTGDGLSKTLTGLDSRKVYYFAVIAMAADGARSLSSPEIRAARPSTTKPTALSFSAWKLNAKQREWPINGYDIYGFGNRATLQLQDGSKRSAWPGGWPEKMLFSSTWGCNIGIKKIGGGSFDLNSLDVASNGDKTGGSAIVIGYDAGSKIRSLTKIINFSPPVKGAASLVHVSLHWVRISRVTIHWVQQGDGQGPARFGAVSKIVVGGASDVFH